MQIFKKHIEWVVFSMGLVALAAMDPANAGISFCIFEQLGIDFCPGEGLGHSISYTFRAEFEAALKAHLMGPLAIIILGMRIIHNWKTLFINYQHKNKDKKNG